MSNIVSEKTNQFFNAILIRLTSNVGGVDHFAKNWYLRSHSPKDRAASALAGGAESISEGIQKLTGNSVEQAQIDQWTDKAIRLWLAMQHAGARTANPMITGPANFPVARNKKAMATEIKRMDEFYSFVNNADDWLRRRQRSVEKAALNALAATVEHKKVDFPGVSIVDNTTLERVQLIFDEKPDPKTIAELKRHAFRWSPREGAWQRKNTNAGIGAANNILRGLGYRREMGKQQH